MTSTFRTAEGCHVPDLTGIHQGYAVRETNGYHVFTINVSSENIPPVFLRLAELPKGPHLFFTIEVGTHRDVEATLRRSDSDPLHKDVYYLDGLAPDAAREVYRAYERPLTHDGGVNFGIGSHAQNDEVFVGPYKVFYVYTVEPEKYRTALSALGLHEEPRIRTVWDTFGPETPGSRSALRDTPKSIWDVIDELKQRGLRLAERRED